MSRKLPRLVALVGQQGSGKTLFASRLLREYSRVLVIDPAHDFIEGLVIEQRDRDREPPAWQETLLALDGAGPRFRFIYRPESIAPNAEGMPWVLRQAFASGDLALFIDEFHTYSGPGFYKVPVLEQLFLMSRHPNLSVIVASQRPADIHKAILHQATKVFFRLEEPAYLDAMRRHYPRVDELPELRLPRVGGKPLEEGQIVNPDRIRLDCRVWPESWAPALTRLC